MIGNGQNIWCTHKGLLDIICIQIYGLSTKGTWEIKIIPPLNDFQFYQCHERRLANEWEHGIVKGFSQIGHDSFHFERMILSRSSWLMSVKVNRILRQACSVIEPKRKLSMIKLHHMTALIHPTANYFGSQNNWKSTSM